MNGRGGGKDFLGFPIPSAAGLVASLTLLIIHFNEKEKDLGHWNYLLPVVLVFLSAMMVSDRAVSQLQIARVCAQPALSPRPSAPRCSSAACWCCGKDPVLCPAGVLHRLPGLRLCAAAAFARVAPGNRGRRGRAGRGPLRPCRTFRPFCLPPCGLRLRIACSPSRSARSISPSSTKARSAVLPWECSSAWARRRWSRFTAPLRSRAFPRSSRTAWSRPRWRCSAFAFLLFLGIKFLMAKTVTAPTNSAPPPKKSKPASSEKLHPHSAFMTGFVRVLGNLGVLLFWIVLAANFMSHDWVDGRLFAAKAACVGGVALGTNTVVLHPELRRVARTRPVQRKDPAAHATFFRHLPDHFRTVRTARTSRGNWPGTNSDKIFGRRRNMVPLRVPAVIIYA